MPRPFNAPPDLPGKDATILKVGGEPVIVLYLCDAVALPGALPAPSIPGTMRPEERLMVRHPADPIDAMCRAHDEPKRPALHPQPAVLERLEPPDVEHPEERRGKHLWIERFGCPSSQREESERRTFTKPPICADGWPS